MVVFADRFANAYFGRGNTYRQQGNLEQAIDDYTHAVEINPQYANAFFNRGISYAERGNNPRAIADLESYLRLTPDASDAQQVREHIDRLQGG